MIQMRSILDIADNTGARRASMIGRNGHPSRYAHVPREGAESRFVPVKDEDDLAAAQDQIAAICRQRLALDA